MNEQKTDAAPRCTEQQLVGRTFDDFLKTAPTFVRCCGSLREYESALRLAYEAGAAANVAGVVRRGAT